MLDTPGAFVLDVMVPHIEHVLPMIPGGGSYKDIITDGDGSLFAPKKDPEQAAS